MKISKARLRQIIQEELEYLKQEQDEPPAETMPFDFAAKSVNPVIIQQEANDAFLAGIIDRVALDRMSNVIQGFRQIKKPSQRDLDKFAAARVELKKAIDVASANDVASAKNPGRLAKYEKLQARRSKRRPTPKDVQRAIAKSPIGKPTSMTAVGAEPKP